jgi:hypothetical protein
MTNLPFVLAVVVAAAVITTAFIAGIKHWRSLGGKIVAVGAGLLLLGLIAFVSLVLVIVISGQAGHPF